MSEIRMATGVGMPAVGLGFWKVDRDAAADVVRAAVSIGYRHLDCACDYGNEVEVGQGIRAVLKAGLCAREDLWVTSKLWNTYHREAHVRPACERSLRDLGLAYLDLYMVHFPISLAYVPFETRYPPEWLYDPDAEQPVMKPDPVPLTETWAEMEALVDAGLVRQLGVCNFNCALLRELLATCRIPPAVLQVELHPYLSQNKLLRFCREAGIAVTGFSPLGAASYVALGMAESTERLMEEPVLRGIAAKHGKTVPQVALRWGIQRGTTVIPKSSNSVHMRENLECLTFALSDADMVEIDALDRGRRYNDPGVFCEAAFNTFYPIYE